jgi:hypothetical protein
MPITLNANGFVLTLDPLLPADAGAHAGCFTGELSLTSTIPDVTQTLRTMVDIPLPDLQRLCDLAEEHVQALIVDGNRESQVWVDSGLSVQVGLLEGDVERVGDHTEGAFGLRVLLYIGCDPATGAGVHSGYEGEVTVGATLAFCRQLGRYIAKQHVAQSA